MDGLSFATLRLGKTSVEDIKELDSKPGGVVQTPHEITVTCTQVPVEFDKDAYVFIWLGSDNSKGIATEWKQGFKAIGQVKSITRGEKYNDESISSVDIKYIFSEAINRLDILKEAAIAYYWCSNLPIIGLDDHSNQTVRMITGDDERSEIGAFFCVLNSVRPEFRKEIIEVEPMFAPLFDFKVISPTAVDREDCEDDPIKFNTGLESIFERNRIMFGAPGTGKSHQLKADCTRLLEGTSGTYERVTFHPEYSYSNFVGCYKPVTNERGEICYKFVPGPFMRGLVAALKSGRTENPQPHLLLIEEINRAKVAAVFGDVFQLLDRDDDGTSEYEIYATEDIKNYLIAELGHSSDVIKIPDNMFIWATMNSADQGVYPMDTAFKRRWSFEYIGIDENDETVGGVVTLGTGTHAVDVNWNKLRKAINEKLAKEYNVNEDKLMGPFFLGRQVFAYGEDGRIINPEKFKAAFKSKVIMYLYEDAAKQQRKRLFPGEYNSKFSTVCSTFDEIGIEIFGTDFKTAYYEKE
jgi:hypothetical protein